MKLLAGTPLWRHLWLWTMAAMGLTWLALAAMAHHVGLYEADEISDGQLAAAAQLWVQAPLSPPAPPARQSRDDLAPERHSYEQPIAVLVWQGDTLLLDSHGLQTQLGTPAAGYLTTSVEVHGELHHWRLFTLQVAQGTSQRRVTTVMDLDARFELGRDIALRLARPAFIVLPLVALLLAWTLRRGLMPWQQLSQRIDALDPFNPQRLATDRTFADFSSTVRAINALMDRLAQQMQQERDFTSDIAHELRTPLTSLALQSHVAITSTDPTQRAQALHTVQSQALHAGNVLAQLLAFARAQRQAGPEVEPVCLNHLGHQTVAEHAQAAHERSQDLALETTAPHAAVTVPGRPLLLALALRNLLDNAIQHNPPGTHIQVDVWADAQGCGISVSNTHAPRPADGPTVAVSAASGLGLGLILAQRIAAWHGAQWQTHPTDAGWPIRFALFWPHQRPSEPMPPTNADSTTNSGTNSNTDRSRV